MDRRKHDFWSDLKGAMSDFGEILAKLPIPIDLEAVRKDDPSSSAVALKLQPLLEGQPVPGLVSIALGHFVDAWFAAHVLALQVKGSPDPLVARACWSSYLMLQATMQQVIDVLRLWQAGEIPPEDLE